MIARLCARKEYASALEYERWGHGVFAEPVGIQTGNLDSTPAGTEQGNGDKEQEYSHRLSGSLTDRA
jgi:hypothetical protein